jgi:hypothetical protein
MRVSSINDRIKDGDQECISAWADNGFFVIETHSALIYFNTDGREVFRVTDFKIKKWWKFWER